MNFDAYQLMRDASDALIAMSQAAKEGHRPTCNRARSAASRAIAAFGECARSAAAKGTMLRPMWAQMGHEFNQVNATLPQP